MEIDSCCSSSWTNIEYAPVDKKRGKRDKERLSCLSRDGSESGFVGYHMIPRLELYSTGKGVCKTESLTNAATSTVYMTFPRLPSKLRRFTTPLYDETEDDLTSTIFDPLTVQSTVPADLNHVAIVAGRGDQNLFKLHFFINERRVWSMGQEIPIPALSKRCLAVSDQCLYFVGGEIGAVPDEIKCQNLFIYNMRTKEVSIGPPLRIPRCDAGVGIWKDTMYIVGGLNRYNHPLTHVDAYDMRQNTWCLIPPMKFARHRPGMIIVDGVIYVIGGHTVHCEWHPIENGRLWAELPKLPAIFRDLAMTATYFKDWIVAFRNFRPDRVAVLDRTVRDEWDVLRTTGVPPDSIEGSFTYEGSCYVSTSSGNLFELHLAQLVWYKSVNCPKSMSKVYHIACANMENFVNY